MKRLPVSNNFSLDDKKGGESFGKVGWGIVAPPCFPLLDGMVIKTAGPGCVLPLLMSFHFIHLLHW